MIAFKHSLLLAGLLVLNLPQSGSAQPGQTKLPSSTPQSCSELLQECFVVSPNEKGACFYSTVSDSFCAESPLKALIYKRWSLSPVQASAPEIPPPQATPYLVDQKCLLNFDTQLSSYLIDDTSDGLPLERLMNALDKCIPTNLQQLPYP